MLVGTVSIGTKNVLEKKKKKKNTTYKSKKAPPPSGRGLMTDGVVISCPKKRVKYMFSPVC